MNTSCMELDNRDKENQTVSQQAFLVEIIKWQCE